MKLYAFHIAITLAGIASITAAAQQPPVTSAAASAAEPGMSPKSNVVWGWGAERIVGTYQTLGQVRKCGTTFPFVPVGNTISFQAGGTVVESPRFPPVGDFNVFGIPGLFTRNIGMGTWSYNPRAHSYSMHLRYDYFVDGVFYGTGTVDRDIQLSADGKTASGPVQSTVRKDDGSVVVDLCGDVASTRL